MVILGVPALFPAVPQQGFIPLFSGHPTLGRLLSKSHFPGNTELFTRAQPVSQTAHFMFPRLPGLGLPVGLGHLIQVSVWHCCVGALYIFIGAGVIGQQDGLKHFTFLFFN